MNSAGITSESGAVELSRWPLRMLKHWMFCCVWEAWKCRLWLQCGIENIHLCTCPFSTRPCSFLNTFWFYHSHCQSMPLNAVPPARGKKEKNKEKQGKNKGKKEKTRKNKGNTREQQVEKKEKKEETKRKK